MVISAENITAGTIEELERKYTKVEKANGGLRISHKDLDFKEIISYLRLRGIPIYSAALE